MEIKGDASKRRFFAANLDAVLALTAGMGLGSILSGANPYVAETVVVRTKIETQPVDPATVAVFE